ncbi:MAG: MucR family transcriptional regulator [Rhodospirillaceae bacterium]
MDKMVPELETHFCRVALTLKKVFGKNPADHVGRYRVMVESVPAEHRILATHDEPYDVAARLLGYRSGQGREAPELETVYERLRMSPDWDAATEGSMELEGTAAIVSSYLRNNRLPKEEIGRLIRDVHAALLGRGVEHPVMETHKPAVPVTKSIYPDYIICLEDGKKLKMLKRYLMSSYNMTPEEYRIRWSLPNNYPMVAPNYAKLRSELAVKTGPGRRGQAAG